MAIAFDSTITLGNVVEMGVVITTIVGMFIRFDSRIKTLETKVENVTSLTLWKERMDERQMILRRDVEELRRGRGWIHSSHGGTTMEDEVNRESLGEK